MNLKNIFNNLVVFAAMYAFLLLIITLSYDFITPIIKAKKASSSNLASAQAFAGVKDQKAILANARSAPKQYVPFVAWKQKPFSSKYVNIDENGFRKTPQPKSSDNKKTIGIFGSSPIWGRGVKDSQTMPAYLAVLEKDYTVKNFAQRGYTSRQNLDLLINLIASNQMPEIVIFNDGFVDTYVLCNPQVTTSLNGHGQEKKIASALEMSKGHSFFNTFLSPLLALPGKIFKKSKYKQPLVCTKDNTKAKAVANTLYANWQMAADLVQSRGGKFIAILQPTAYHTKSPVEELKLKTKRKYKTLGPSVLAIYSLVTQTVSEKQPNWFKNFTTIYDGSKNYVFFDDIHVAAHGNKIYAAKIADVLKASND